MFMGAVFNKCIFFKWEPLTSWSKPAVASAYDEYRGRFDFSQINLWLQGKSLIQSNNDKNTSIVYAAVATFKPVKRGTEQIRCSMFIDGRCHVHKTNMKQ